MYSQKPNSEVNMKDNHTLRILTRLYKIVEAGEKGYAVAASNVSNRAVKILFSSFAQQRLNFKEEIFQQMQHMGAEARPRSNILGILHRGRIDIFAALTIGEENVEKTVLKEVMVGERVALKVYQDTLEENLPPETRAMVERQAREVRGAVDQVRAMKGIQGKRQLIRLYDSKADAEGTARELKNAGFSDD